MIFASDSRKSAWALIELCDSGVLDSREVLENVLTNYMSSDDANDFAESEYPAFFEDDESNEDESEDDEY